LITARSALWVARLATLLLFLGVAAALWGTAYTVNGMTQAPAYVKVPVTLVGAEPWGSGWGNVQLQVPGVEVPGGWIAGARPDGISPSGVDGRVTIAAWGSTRVEQLLGRGDWLVRGIGLLVAALVLVVAAAFRAGETMARDVDGLV
jgi:hypothetical protein